MNTVSCSSRYPPGDHPTATVDAPPIAGLHTTHENSQVQQHNHQHHQSLSNNVNYSSDKNTVVVFDASNDNNNNSNNVNCSSDTNAVVVFDASNNNINSNNDNTNRQSLQQLVPANNSDNSHSNDTGLSLAHLRTPQILSVRQSNNTNYTKPPPPGRLIHVESKPNDWIITVPLEYDDGVHWTEMQADPGADACGINTQWAVDTFNATIQQTTHALDISTPGGMTKSNAFVNLFFKRYDDVTWTTRFTYYQNYQ